MAQLACHASMKRARGSSTEIAEAVDICPISTVLAMLDGAGTCVGNDRGEVSVGSDGVKEKIQLGHLKKVSNQDIQYKAHVTYTLEEGFGENDPYVSTLFEEIWTVVDNGDSASRVSGNKHYILNQDEDGEEVDSVACKKRKLNGA